jgi:very-short-patch-repair endonuclease
MSTRDDTSPLPDERMPRRGRRPHGRERSLRKTATPHERLLWGLLRDRRFSGFKFRRQHRLGNAIVDFVCLECRVVIELDGSQHNEHSGRDRLRDAQLHALGFEVLRFWNLDWTQRRSEVLDVIWRSCVTRAPDRGAS